MKKEFPISSELIENAIDCGLFIELRSSTLKLNDSSIESVTSTEQLGRFSRRIDSMTRRGGMVAQTLQRSDAWVRVICVPIVWIEAPSQRKLSEAEEVRKFQMHLESIRAQVLMMIVESNKAVRLPIDRRLKTAVQELPREQRDLFQAIDEPSKPLNARTQSPANLLGAISAIAASDSLFYPVPASSASAESSNARLPPARELARLQPARPEVAPIRIVDKVVAIDDANRVAILESGKLVTSTDLEQFVVGAEIDRHVRAAPVRKLNVYQLVELDD